MEFTKVGAKKKSKIGISDFHRDAPELLCGQAKVRAKSDRNNYLGKDILRYLRAKKMNQYTHSPALPIHYHTNKEISSSVTPYITILFG